MLLGLGKSKHFMQGVREALELSLRGVGRYEVVNDIDQARHLYVCS